MPIRSPVKVKRRGDESLFSTFVYDNEDFETVFVRGAIAFPSFDPLISKFHGAISVCASNPKNGKTTLHMLEQFSIYDETFFNLVKKIADTFKINQFYYDRRRVEDARKLMQVCDRSRRDERDNSISEMVYPELIPLTFSSDFYAYSTLLEKITSKKFAFDGRSTFLIYSVQWDETKPFTDSPPEIQAVCANAYGNEKDVSYYARKEDL